ncbi:hypothetical protein E6O75_ATG09111 [Venturia nashicola]|uniref:Uncharacterized protein n=1 Tax=Venturia nashicola TaxID=86259 RepID=A0A4Z1NMV9_9PEZI|nr:hypothetical protein E6O75_ATG09111 [Venturia nashicola]
MPRNYMSFSVVGIGGLSGRSRLLPLRFGILDIRNVLSIHRFFCAPGIQHNQTSWQVSIAENNLPSLPTFSLALDQTYTSVTSYPYQQSPLNKPNSFQKQHTNIPRPPLKPISIPLSHPLFLPKNPSSLSKSFTTQIPPQTTPLASTTLHQKIVPS